MRFIAEHDIKVKVTLRFGDGDELPITRAPGGGDRRVQWDRMSASTTVDDDGDLGHIIWTGTGFFLKQDGTVGRQNTSQSYGSMTYLSRELVVAITAALETEAARIKVTS